MNTSSAIDGPWVARCAHRLRQQWPHAELTSLEEAALELWNDPRWRSLPPEQAAERWLAPLQALPRQDDRKTA